MVVDLDTEEGKILMGLASIGAMLVGVDSVEPPALPAREIPLAVLAFKGRFNRDRVVATLRKLVDYLVKRN